MMYGDEVRKLMDDLMRFLFRACRAILDVPLMDRERMRAVLSRKNIEDGNL